VTFDAFGVEQKAYVCTDKHASPIPAKLLMQKANTAKDGTIFVCAHSPVEIVFGDGEQQLVKFQACQNYVCIQGMRVSNASALACDGLGNTYLNYEGAAVKNKELQGRCWCKDFVLAGSATMSNTRG